MTTNTVKHRIVIYYYNILLLLPLALQPAVGFGLSNNTSPFINIISRNQIQRNTSNKCVYYPVPWHRVSIEVGTTNICLATNSDVRRVADVLGEPNKPLPLTGSTQR
jgi:hypothetical protein